MRRGAVVVGNIWGSKRAQFSILLQYYSRTLAQGCEVVLMDRVSHPAPSAVVLCRPSVADAAAMFLEANLRGGGKGEGSRGRVPRGLPRVFRQGCDCE